MAMVLTKREGLYYTHTDVLTVDKNLVRRSSHTVQRLATPHTTGTRWSDPKFRPVSKAAHTESELWMVWLGFPGEDQMDMLPGNVTSIPSTFQFHPFRFVDFKEQACICICKQAVQRLAEHTTNARKQFLGFEPTSMLPLLGNPATLPISTRVLTGRVAGLSSNGFMRASQSDCRQPNTKTQSHSTVMGWVLFVFISG